MILRRYILKGEQVTAAEFADAVSDLLVAGWTLQPPKDPDNA